MRIGTYGNDCGLIEIKEIRYCHYSRKETMVYYDYYYENKMVVFEGWLSLDQIVEKLIEIVKDSDVK